MAVISSTWASGRSSAWLIAGAFAVLSAFFAAACGTPAPSPSAGDTSTGAIAGVVTTTATARPAIRITTDTAACGTAIADESVVTGANGALANAVVVIRGLAATGEPDEVTMANDACRFAPRVAVARPAQPVRTLSRDTVLHTTTAHAVGGGPLFNLALPVPNLTLERPAGDAGVVAITCQMHPWMRGWIVVTPDRAVVTGADGGFSFDDVPPGEYDLRIWHETLGESTTRVRVEAGMTATADVALR